MPSPKRLRIVQWYDKPTDSWKVEMEESDYGEYAHYEDILDHRQALALAEIALESALRAIAPVLHEKGSIGNAAEEEP